MAMSGKIYPRTGDEQTVYLKNVIIGPGIEVGDYTIYNDFVNDPREFERNNVLYHYPINGDNLVIGKFSSIACGAKFLFNSANHSLTSLSAYTFPLFFQEWGLDKKKVIRKRFDDETIKRLKKLKWWDWPEEIIRESIPWIQAGDIDKLEKEGEKIAGERGKELY